SRTSGGNNGTPKETSIVNYNEPRNAVTPDIEKNMTEPPILNPASGSSYSGSSGSGTSMYQGASGGSNFTKTEEGYITPKELTGRSNEDIAGKKTQAKVQTSSDKWVTEEGGGAKTSDKVRTGENQNTGNKHAYQNEGTSKAYHTVDPNADSRFGYKDEGDLTAPNARVTDASGRILETGEGVGGHTGGSLMSSITAAPFHQDDGKFEERRKAENVDIPVVDVSKVNRNTDIAKKVGEVAQAGVEGRYQDADAVQGAKEMKDETNRIAFASGATAIKHAAERAAIHGGITQRGDIDKYSRFDVDEYGDRRHGKPGIKVTKDDKGAIISTSQDKTALRKGLDQAESEAGGKFVTSSKNSYGSLVKDIKNNLFIIDNHFKKNGLDLSGYNEKQIKAAINRGYLVNKVGKNVQLSASDRALLNERLKLMKKEKALKATGTWKEDAMDFLSSTYGDSDAYQGYRVAKTTAKAGKAAIKTGKAIVGGTVKGVISVASGVMRAPNTIARAGVNIAGGIGGIGSKRIRKWRYDQNAKFRAKNAKIKVSTGKIKGTAGKFVSSPVKSLGSLAGKGVGKLAGATIGRTRFGKAVSKGAGRVKSSFDWLKRKRLNATNKIKNNAFTKAAGAPVKALGKVFNAFNAIKLFAIILALVLIASTTFIIILTSGVSAFFPAGADPDNFEAGQVTLWEQAKDGMNQELEDISKDCTSWLRANYREYRRKRLGRDLSYETEFVFNGFEFDGPTYNVTDRTSDTEAQNAYTTAMNQARNTTETTVKKGDTATKEKYYSGHNGNLTKSRGTINGPSGKETYYNLDMANCVHTLDLHCKGKVGGLSNTAHYFVRDDGVKCYGDEHGIAYVIVAANLSLRPKGTIVMTSLGPGIVADTGTFAATNPRQLDIAVAWVTDGSDNDKYKTVNSGTVDTWGSDLNSGSLFVDGKKACASNYLRGILAMATTATGNEDDPDNSAFYTAYCRHILRNSYNYSKYVAAKKWLSDWNKKKIHEKDLEPSMKKAWDDDFYLSDSIDHFNDQPAFEISIMDEKFNKYGHLIKVIFSVKLRFLDCGLWGEGDYTDEGGQAGTGDTPDTVATSVGMFDVETYNYTAQDFLGMTVKNDICDDDFIHQLAASGSSEYDVQDKNSSGYEYWDGWEDEEEFNGRDLYIYESGSNTSNVEATYDIEDEDWAEMGVSFDGLYNIDNTGSSEGDSGGSSSPLTAAEITEISNNVSTSLGKNDAPERADVIAKALSLCGKVRYTWGGSWNSHTTDAQVES
ncbi:MAG: hypothetical protein ACI4CS_00200, partial [Candidatus Weimeria sp.]